VANRPSLDRLAELETLAPDEDCPPDARFSVPASDLRDLLALIPMVRAADRVAAAASVVKVHAVTLRQEELAAELLGALLEYDPQIVLGASRG
jgi:hypothetical protein